VPFVPAGVPILVAAVVAAVIGWFSHGRSDEGLEPDVDPFRERHWHGDHRAGHAQGAPGNTGKTRPEGAE
ncbi:MAG: branched-chain amino acid ABC transporter permease, partial [Actinomycetes bacterium]